jgi:hypothetical protein
MTFNAYPGPILLVYGAGLEIRVPALQSALER